MPEGRRPPVLPVPSARQAQRRRASGPALRQGRSAAQAGQSRFRVPERFGFRCRGLQEAAENVLVIFRLAR